MSEYIIDTEKINELNRGNVTSWLSPYAISDTSVFPPRTKETHFAVTLPEIVRCSDCKHYWATMGECSRFYNEEMLTDDGTTIFPDVEPDGFCAWAIRRG